MRVGTASFRGAVGDEESPHRTMPSTIPPVLRTSPLKTSVKGGVDRLPRGRSCHEVTEGVLAPFNARRALRGVARSVGGIIPSVTAYAVPPPSQREAFRVLMPSLCKGGCRACEAGGLLYMFIACFDNPSVCCATLRSHLPLHRGGLSCSLAPKTTYRGLLRCGLRPSARRRRRHTSLEEAKL